MYQLNSGFAPAWSHLHSSILALLLDILWLPGQPHSGYPLLPHLALSPALAGGQPGNQSGLWGSKTHSYCSTFQMVTFIVWWNQPWKAWLSAIANKDEEAKLNRKCHQCKSPGPSYLETLFIQEHWLLMQFSIPVHWPEWIASLTSM
jgi:hypothetical protein